MRTSRSDASHPARLHCFQLKARFFVYWQLVQYIGEICRYVLATPVQASDTQHRIRYMIGNGMRTAVWQRFVDRFRIPHVVELYGSTEGNVTFCEWIAGDGLCAPNLHGILLN